MLCITHLPQVASLADVHFRLEKDVAGEQRLGDGRAARRRGRGRGDPPHARRRELATRRRPARARAARRRLSASVALAALAGAWPNLSRWPPPVAVAFLLCSGVATARGRTAPIEGTARLGRADQAPGQAPAARRRRRHRPRQHRPDRRRGADRSRRRAVLNASPSSNGRYPNAGPLMLARAGDPARRRARRRPLRAAQRRRPAADRRRHGLRRRRGGAARAGARRRRARAPAARSSASGSTRRWPSSPRTRSPTCARRPTC